jgi:hypothetical protein
VNVKARVTGWECATHVQVKMFELNRSKKEGRRIKNVLKQSIIVCVFSVSLLVSKGHSLESPNCPKPNTTIIIISAVSTLTTNIQGRKHMRGGTLPGMIRWDSSCGEGLCPSL